MSKCDLETKTPDVEMWEHRGDEPSRKAKVRLRAREALRPVEVVQEFVDMFVSSFQVGRAAMCKHLRHLTLCLYPSPVTFVHESIEARGRVSHWIVGAKLL
jgi:hypothetical protein